MKRTIRKILDKKDIKETGVALIRTAQYISTLEAARLCGVSTFSIQRWFDEGLLIGARLPGGKRKIEAESLRRFMQEHGLLPSPSAVKTDRMRILIVEDDAKLMDVMKEYLVQDGDFLVQTATNGLDAGLALSEFKPDAVILDVMLEDVPARSLVQRIRQSPVGRSARIVAISGKAHADDIREIKAAGANAFLQKPFEMRELLKALKLPAGARD
jgi:CheY-like chemotaxis protein